MWHPNDTLTYSQVVNDQEALAFQEDIALENALCYQDEIDGFFIRKTVITNTKLKETK